MDLTELVKKAQAGDRQAVGAICLRFTGLVKKYAFQPHIRPMAQDAEAEGWLAVMEGIRKYDETTGVPFAGYIESRVKYAVWNVFKRERRRWQQEQLDVDQQDKGLSILERLAGTTDVAGEVVGHWLLQEIQKAISALPVKQRLVISRTVLGEERLGSIALELGITPQAVHNLQKRGLARLKIQCSGMYEDVRR